MTKKKTVAKKVSKKTVAKTTKTVTITRRRWANPKNIDKFNEVQEKRAEDNRDYEEKCADAALYDDASKLMCCLGFVCRAQGLPVKDIKDVGLPTDVRGFAAPTWLIDIESKAAAINDDESLDNKTRERMLAKLFREHTPIRLKFVP